MVVCLCGLKNLVHVEEKLLFKFVIIIIIHSIINITLIMTDDISC